jgi:hypothetical protein
MTNGLAILGGYAILGVLLVVLARCLLRRDSGPVSQRVDGADDDGG